MKYELAKELKDAGFEQHWDMTLNETEARGRNWPSDCGYHLVMDEPELVESIGSENCKKRRAYVYTQEFIDSEEGRKRTVYIPILEQLIEACGEDFDMLVRYARVSEDLSRKEIVWQAHGLKPVEGSTPTEAVARLWLALNKHD